MNAIKITPSERQDWHKVYLFFHWFFTGGALRLILFALMCGGTVLFIIGIMVGDVTVIRNRRAVQRFNNLSQEDRMGQVSRVLSALLGRSGVNIGTLRDLTGFNRELLEHIVAQLRAQGYLKTAGPDFLPHDIFLTKEGKELFNQLHSERREEANFYIGDIFHVGHNSTVVNRSAIFDSLNSASKGIDRNSREVLRGLTDLVLKSGSPVAVENLEGFLDELDKENPKKSVLNSLLNGIATATPSMLMSSEMAENVRKIIAGI